MTKLPPLVWEEELAERLTCAEEYDEASTEEEPQGLPCTEAEGTAHCSEEQRRRIEGAV